MSKVLKVLAVDDPAVYAYTDKRYNLVNNFKGDFTVDFNIVPWSEYYGTMMEAFEGKREYDIVMIAGHLWLKDFINKGYIAPVEALKDCGYNYEDILPVIREEIELDGVQYLYPSFCDGHVVLYRKSIVEKVLGKLPGKVITTDELIDMAAFCNGYNGMRGIALKADPSEIFLDFIPYLRNEGVDAINKTTLAPEFNNAKGQRALKKYLSLKAFAPTNTGSFGNEELKNAFQKKECVLAVTWGGQLGTILGEGCADVEDIGFAALKTSWNVTWSFAINNLSDKKAEANEFLKYITSKAADRVVGGYAGSPVRKSTYLADRNKYNWYDMHLELIEKYARPLPGLLKAGDKFGVLYDAIGKAFNSEITIVDCLEQAEDKINKI
ncbi:MAG: multiple sugar transport system substrate-binding protein [Clostridium sp.]|jgi:multiple sugar transport system substrate-binding protein